MGCAYSTEDTPSRRAHRELTREEEGLRRVILARRAPAAAEVATRVDATKRTKVVKKRVKKSRKTVNGDKSESEVPQPVAETDTNASRTGSRDSGAEAAAPDGRDFLGAPPNADADAPNPLSAPVILPDDDRDDSDDRLAGHGLAGSGVRRLSNSIDVPTFDSDTHAFRSGAATPECLRSGDASEPEPDVVTAPVL